MTTPTAKIPVKPPPSTALSSFFDRQVWRRCLAAVWAVVITILVGVIAGGVALLVVGVVLLYVTFLSRLLPTQVASPLAAALDVLGEPMGWAVLSLLLTVAGWYFTRRIFQRDTTAGLLGRVDARAVNLDDKREHVVVTWLKELAATAQVPKPSALIFDGPSCNAAAIGDCLDRAGVLVSRETLDLLQPSEQRAVLAHLLACGINGDLRITDAVLRGFCLMGSVVTLFDLPFSRGARTSWLVLLRHAFPSAKKSEPDGEAIAEAFVRVMQPDALESLTIFLRKLVGEENDVRSIGITVLYVLLLPILLARLVGSLVISITSLLLLGPTVTLILRGRRMHTDATAVALTKDATALSTALATLYAAPRSVASAGWSEMSFFAGPELPTDDVLARLRTWGREILFAVNNYSARLRLQKTSAQATSAGTGETRNVTSSHEFVFGFHPPLAARLAQLQRLGAPPITAAQVRRDSSTWMILGVLLLGIGLVLIFALPALRRWL